MHIMLFLTSRSQTTSAFLFFLFRPTSRDKRANDMVAAEGPPGSIADGHYGHYDRLVSAGGST